MRLGLVIYGNLDLITGGFIFDKLVVDYLRRQGDEVEILALPWQSYARGVLHNVQAGLERRLRRARFDILIQDELSHPSLFWLNQRLKLHVDYPIISLVHLLRASEERPAWQNRFYRWIEQRYLRSVDGFICISRHTRGLVESLAGRGKPCTVAYPAGDRLGGLTPEQIARRVATPGPRRILYLGAVIPRKGLHVLLQALAPLKNEAWQLTVAGSLTTDPAYTAKIYDLISKLGLSHKILLPGVRLGPDLISCLAQSHILAVPSYMEGLALVYLEGMYYGLVPLASSGGAAGEVITSGRDGFLIPPQEVEALTDCLRELLQDKGKLLTMSLAARERISRHPTWEETGATIRKFLQAWPEHTPGTNTQP
jgi:glycosyltransferase involved in cell wall biosynthesis